MNAVNLIPRESRPGRLSLTTSPQTLALFAGLTALLVAAFVYVSAANKVTAHRNELAKVTASASAWKTVASAFGPYVSLSQQHAQQLAAVRQLAAARFPWPRVLDQIAQLLPSDAALSSLTASPAATSSTSSSSSSSSSSSASTSPTFALSGCAASPSAVAQTMQQLRALDGGSTVTLSSSSTSGTGPATTGSGSSGTSASGTSGCPYPVTFQMTLTVTGASSQTPQTSVTPGTGSTTSTTATPTTNVAAQ